MKLSEYRGFSQVLKFTFIQAIKSKSLIITTLIMMGLALVAFPVMSLLNKEDGDYESPIEKVYVINNTDIKSIPCKEAFEGEQGFDKIAFEDTNKSVEDIIAGVSEEHPAEIILDISLSPETGSYLFDFYRDPDSSVDTEDASKLARVITEWFAKYKVRILDADEETLEMVGKVVDYTLMDSGEFLETDVHEIISDADYNIVYAFLMISYMVVILAASMVSSKVVEEKANRVVEYLMTTVRPMALILGKVVAMLSVTIAEISLIAVSGIISSKLSALINGATSNKLLSNYLSADAIKNLSLPNALTCILTIALGIFIYGLLAGLFGASVSKMEDLQQGLKAYTFIILIAFFACMSASQMMWIVGINGFVKFTMILPFTSVMILPGAILIGKASASLIIIAVLLQIVTAVIVLKIVSLVYETIIVMNGNPVSIKQMFAIIRRK